MENLYKCKKEMILFNLFIYMLAGVMVGVLVFQFAKSIVISLIFAILLFLIISFSSIFNSVMKVIVDNNDIVLYERNNVKRYNKREVEFKYRMSNLNYILIIEYEDETHYYDCSFLGKKQFVELLNKLKINKGV